MWTMSLTLPSFRPSSFDGVDADAVSCPILVSTDSVQRDDRRLLRHGMGLNGAAGSTSPDVHER
jgi:hypothetical protein